MQKIWKRIRKTTGILLDNLGRFRLMTAYMTILIIAIVFLPMALLITNRNARSLIQHDYQEYNETIFRQAETGLNNNLNDLTTLCYTCMPNTILADYLANDSFSDRVEMQNVVNQEINRMIVIENDIKAVSLYRQDGKRVVYVGIKSNQDSLLLPTDSIAFGGVREIEGETYFTVTLPIFDVRFNKIQSRLGYCQMLVTTDFLERSLIDMMPNPDYFYVIQSSDGQVILQAGEVPSEVFTGGVPSGAAQVIYSAELQHTGWRIVFGVPRKQLYASLNSLQRNNILTYSVVGLIFIAMFLILHATVIRPIHQQIRFMNRYAQTREGRMEVTAENEMGELADHLNHMLDDIERLTSENIRTQEHLLEVEYQKKRSELLAYRNQINPHFLNNTFECIRGMALYHHVPDIAAITDALSRLFSYNLKGKGYAEIHEVITHIEDYTSVIRYRFNNRFRIVVEADSDTQHLIFPKMIIQPLVENAIFHGLESREEGGEVHVKIRRIGKEGAEGQLEVTVQDNGKGMNEEEKAALKADLVDFDRSSLFPERKHGIGVLNVYRRLKLFYGEKMTFDVNSCEGQGTVIRILVPRIAGDVEENDVQDLFDR